MRKLLALLFVFFSMASIIITPCYARDYSIPWTDEEIAFMDSHPVIRLGVDPKFVPFEFIDKDGKYKGITADYLALISKKTGMKFEIVKGIGWPEAYRMALSGDVDALPAISKTYERAQYFRFSQPYYYFKRVIVIRDTDTGIAGIEDLDKLSIAVQQNSSHHSYLLAYPKINLSLYNSVEAALTAVANGTERAFVGNLATTSYLMKSNGLTNLKFIAFEAEQEQALYFAVRKDWPYLESILNKALDTITEEEKIGINNKWIDLESENDYGPILRIVAMVGIVAGIVMLVSFYWIIRLKKEARLRECIQKDLQKAKEEAEKANEFKSSFMARMSHEIRTPLNAIMGMSYLLKKTEISLTQVMYVDRISQAANNMLSIINDILDYSKIEAGKVELEISSFSLDQLIQNVVNIVSYKIEEQKIGFRLSKDSLVPNWFYGDAKRIEQVLINILNNAAKFTSAGEVALDIRLVAKENGKCHLAFSVKDTGIGMTEEQAKKLFMPFVQGDSTINRRFGGSGLGLSIANNLVEMMGGQIKLFSTPGEGSTFVVDLSLSVDKEKEEEWKRNLSTKQFKDVRTLVLEKSGANMNLIESYLGAFGMHCELTSSQVSTVAMLEAADGKFAKPFDLFIVDYETPTEEGFKFVDDVNNNNRIIKKPKIMMLLPMMREDLFDKLDEHGIGIGIGKPIIPSILLNGIVDIFKLKAVSASSFSANNEGSKIKPKKTYKVLLAEDNKTNQLIAKSILQQVGIESILANDGKEAVELYQMQKNNIDLILMDLHMPGMNGYEAAQEIRKISASVPIVAMTADVILGVRERCEECGIGYYISKPFEPEYFVKTVIGIIEENENKVSEDFCVLDQAAGLKNMGDDEELFKEVLNEYFIENQNTLDKLTTAIGEKKYAEAAKIVHKVKGSSGSIGAKSIYNLAIKLQDILSQGKEDEIPILQEKFSCLFSKLLEEIAAFQSSKSDIV